MSSLGETFRHAREARGFALSDVSEQIHIRSVYLNAIENEDWPSIGAPVYTRGFLRTYARFLGLDAEAIVSRYNEIAGEAAATAPVLSSGSSERGGPSVWVIGISIVAVLLVLFAGYEYYQYKSGGPATVASDPTPAAAPVSAASASAAADQATPAPDASAEASSEPSPEQATATSNSLDIRLTQRSWLRVVVDGKSVMEGLFPAGTVRSVIGKTATIRAGNAAGVSVTLNGKSIGALGGSGDVVERTFNLRGE